MDVNGRLLEGLPELSSLSDEESEGDELVFSRSGHIKSLGLQLASLDNQPPTAASPHTPNIDTTDSTMQIRSTTCTSAQVESAADDKGPVAATASWEQFKANFSDGLRESEDKLSLPEAPPSLADIKQQLLFDAILSLHSDSGPQENGVAGSKSPKLRKNLLSMQSLETIHESELDKMLESDDIITSGGVVMTGASPPSAPRLVWAKEDTGQLMRELEHLNKKTNLPATEAASLKKPQSSMNGGVQPSSKSSTNDTIFIDLRPPPADNKPADDSSESDDPYSWMSQRREFKQPQKTTSPSHSIDTIKSQSASTETTLPTSGQDNMENDQYNEISEAAKPREISSATSCPIPISRPAGAHRQRNSESLTLSSSYSDTNSLESPALSPSKASLSKGKKNGKKQAKKSKKNRKKEPVPEKKDSSKSSQRKLARKLVLERIRNDSLTSSDEEHCLTPNEALPVSDHTPNTQGSEEETLDPIKVKQKLTKIIQAKRPPSVFETPGTNTLFNEEVSFGAPLMATHPSIPTNNLLVFPLSEQGLVALPSDHEECDLELQLLLHMCLLTWLARQAASTCEGATSELLITGLQQTVLDGAPSLVVGVSGSSPCIEQSQLAECLSPVLSSGSVRELTEPGIRDKLTQITQLPLKSFLTVHEDTAPLSSALSFYWYTGYNVSCLPSDESLRPQAPPSTTVSTLPAPSILNCDLVFNTLHCVYGQGLYLAGVRIVYDPHPTLALAVRATDAVYRWMDLMGPQDYNLAKVTDPDSLVARFGEHGSQVIDCVRTPYLVGSSLAKWFGGRACLKTRSVLGISDQQTKIERKKRQRVRFSGSESEDGLQSPALDVTFPPLISNRHTLIAQPYSKVLLIVAPLVPPSLYSTVLGTVTKLGFDVLGVKRMRLNTKRALSLGIDKFSMAAFTPSSTPPSPTVAPMGNPLFTAHAQNTPPHPSLVLYLGKENSYLHTIALRKAVCQDLESAVTLNPSVGKYGLSFRSSDHILHVTEMSIEISKILGSFALSATVPSPLPRLHEDRKRCGQYSEELCLVAVPHSNSLPRVLNLLEKVYCISKTGEEPLVISDHGDSKLGRFEMLGLKVVPQIPRFHAKRLCPLPQTDKAYQSSVNSLTDTPATLLLFRALDCIHRLRDLLPSPTKPKSPLHTTPALQQLQLIVSKDFEEAFNLANIFFTDKDIFADSASLGMASYLPAVFLQDANILVSMSSPPDSLLSVVRLGLPDARLVIKVLDRLSRANFKFVAMRTVESVSVASESSTNISKSSQPLLAVCVERVNAVWYLKQVIQPLLTNNKDLINYPESLSAAVRDVQQYFPEGVCSSATITQEYKVDSRSCDVMDGLVLPESCYYSPDPSLHSLTSPLLETTAMILPPCLLRRDEGSHSSFVEVLEFIYQCRFEIRGIKMIQFSKSLSERLLQSCDITGDTQGPDLSSGPSVVVVVRRDNAASCASSIFKSVMVSAYRPNSAIVGLLPQLLVPSTAKQAKELLNLLTVDY